MDVLTARRYFCINVEHCSLARAERPFTAREFGKSSRCGGQPGLAGCGHQLERGKDVFLGLRLAYALSAIALATVGGDLIHRQLNPEPLTGIEFRQSTSVVVEAETAVARIAVIRRAADGQRRLVRYRTTAGNARPGMDYQEVSGELVFEPGQLVATIEIPVFADTEFGETDETVNVYLEGVVGNPTHRLVIKESIPDENVLAAVNSQVRELSRVANQIAIYLVKTDVVLETLRNQTELEEPTLAALRKRLTDLQASTKSARDRYVELFTGLKGLERSVTFKAMNDWIETLGRRGFEQQQSATRIMMQQFERFLTTGNLEVDVWFDELLQAVPAPARERRAA